MLLADYQNLSYASFMSAEFFYLIFHLENQSHQFDLYKICNTFLPLLALFRLITSPFVPY